MMHPRLSFERVLVVVGLFACSPDSELVGTLGTSSGTTDESPTTTDGSAGDTADAGTASSSSSTGSADDDACSSFDAAACPEDCAVVSGWRVADESCSANPIDLCVAFGKVPEAVPTTFWMDAPDGPVFLEVGGCGIDAQPTEDWRECDGSESDPIDCACFCAQGLCAGEADHLALEACGLPEWCPPVAVDFLTNTANVRAEQCVLEALADHLPGVYEWSGSNGFGGGRILFYVEETSAQIISHSAGDIPECPTTSGWSATSRCELATSEYFTACLDLLGTEDDCALTPEAWTTDCVVEPPACPPLKPKSPLHRSIGSPSPRDD